MLRISITFIALSIVFFGCNGSPKDSKAKADSTNNFYDSLNNKKGGRGTRALSGPDADFAVEAANGSLLEVELGKLAQRKSGNAEIKAFGAMMEKDHMQAGNELEAIAKQKRMALPSSPGGEEHKTMEELNAKSVSEFDKSYVNAMVKDHESDMKKFTNGRKLVHYPEMTKFIDKTLPILKMHYEAALRLQQKFR
ncbi:DUF4142 domain-containing protein [Mucilaginibacter sp. SMC90]|uniref:DUF4142 domain-containing protein n=1 Tax=unclassified Mucilaginibacter TaxID=2617802 RepID=UPI001FB30F4C|nr:DUF4142 domain-containing protein [Mucilaginibacter sp. SMC90]UOE52443.1 DUF4142 domain-containing protein [Mucilaginibacter sp. SMC90]